MKTKILIVGAVVLFLFALVVLGFLAWGFYGKGKGMAEKDCAEAKIVEVIKEKEVIKYVEKEKAQIWTRPSVGLSITFKRMRNGEL